MVADVNEGDFRTFYNEKEKKWAVRQKWADGVEPEPMRRSIAEYNISQECREEYEQEFHERVENGWLGRWSHMIKQSRDH